MSVNIYICSN